MSMQISIGSVVKVSHPVTCLNPDEYFQIAEMRYDLASDKTWIRGENTCWFNANMILDVEEYQCPDYNHIIKSKKE